MDEHQKNLILESNKHERRLFYNGPNLRNEIQEEIIFKPTDITEQLKELCKKISIYKVDECPYYVDHKLSEIINESVDK